MNFHESHPAVHICVRYSNFYRLDISNEYTCCCQVSIEGPELNLLNYTRLKLSWIYRFGYDNVKQFQIISESSFVIRGHKTRPNDNKIRQVVEKSIEQLTSDIKEKRFLNTSMKPLEKISVVEVEEIVAEIKEKLVDWFELH